MVWVLLYFMIFSGFDVVAETTRDDANSVSPGRSRVRRAQRETQSSPDSFRADFIKAWKACERTCVPTPPLQVWGDKNHCEKAEGSCHNSGEAVDVGSITCGARTYTADTSQGMKKMTKIVNCLGRNGAKTIWQAPGHYKHFHVNFPGCNKKVGCD